MPFFQVLRAAARFAGSQAKLDPVSDLEAGRLDRVSRAERDACYLNGKCWEPDLLYFERGTTSPFLSNARF